MHFGFCGRVKEFEDSSVKLRKRLATNTQFKNVFPEYTIGT